MNNNWKKIKKRKWNSPWKNNYLYSVFFKISENYSICSVKQIETQQKWFSYCCNFLFVSLLILRLEGVLGKIVYFLYHIIILSLYSLPTFVCPGNCVSRAIVLDAWIITALALYSLIHSFTKVFKLLPESTRCEGTKEIHSLNSRSSQLTGRQKCKGEQIIIIDEGNFYRYSD